MLAKILSAHFKSMETLEDCKQAVKNEDFDITQKVNGENPFEKSLREKKFDIALELLKHAQTKLKKKPLQKLVCSENVRSKKVPLEIALEEGEFQLFKLLIACGANGKREFEKEIENYLDALEQENNRAYEVLAAHAFIDDPNKFEKDVHSDELEDSVLFILMDKKPELFDWTLKLVGLNYKGRRDDFMKFLNTRVGGKTLMNHAMSSTNIPAIQILCNLNLKINKNVIGLLGTFEKQIKSGSKEL